MPENVGYKIGQGQLFVYIFFEGFSFKLEDAT